MVRVYYLHWSIQRAYENHGAEHECYTSAIIYLSISSNYTFKYTFGNLRPTAKSIINGVFSYLFPQKTSVIYYFMVHYFLQ